MAATQTSALPPHSVERRTRGTKQLPVGRKGPACHERQRSAEAVFPPIVSSRAVPAHQPDAGLSPRLLSGAVWAMGAQLVTLAAGLLTGALLTRLLPPAEVAGYFLAVSLVTVAGVVVTTGIPQAAVRLLARSRAMHAPDALLPQLRSLLGTAGTLALPLALLTGGLAAWLVRPVVSSLPAAPTVILLTAWVAAVGAQRLLGECFRGLSDFREASIYGGPLGAVLTLAGLLAYLATGQRPGLPLIVGTVTGSVVVNVAVAALSLRRRIKRLPSSEQASTPPIAPLSGRPLLMLSLPLMMTTLSLMVAAQADLWVVSASVPAEDVALYAVAGRVSALIGVPLVITNAVLAPLVARMHTQGRRVDLQVLLRGSSAICAVPVFAAVAAIALGRNTLLQWVYGDYYSGAASIMVTLSVGQAVAVLTGSCGLLLAMSGHQNVLMTVTIAGVALSLAVMLTLVGPYGAEGVAIAAAAGLIAQNLAIMVAARSLVGVWTVGSPRAAVALLSPAWSRALLRLRPRKQSH